ncbi:hypothetical protein DL95DRAFT_447242 [Leptodontidium sp. 2 PMI_412]|nr:hypothetical protein DL95DRAFT_447242 [Leptodontidium sp. 2 PMI_412]
MVTPAFGFSVGDFIAGGQLLIEVINAFKEAGGASSKYASEVSFLNGLKSTLDHLEQFVSSTSQSNQLSPVISKLLNDIRGPWDEFKKFLDKYEPSLGASSSRSKLGKAPRTIQYTAKDISGKVGNLRRQTEQPLQAVNSLLSLHVIQSLETLPEQLLNPTQCAQLVQAIALADIPTELDKQIRVLTLAADSHNVKQDQQLEIIATLRFQLEDKLETLQSVLNEVKDEQIKDKALKERNEEQVEISKDLGRSVEKLAITLEKRTDVLEEGVKEQKKLILALKSFLEDKVSRFEVVLKSGDDKQGQGEAKEKTVQWPSATLSTAYFAALLLSSVLSSVAVTSVVNRREMNSRYLGRKKGCGPVFLPNDHSLPGLRSTVQSQTEPSVPEAVANGGELSTIEVDIDTQLEPNLSTNAKVSEWLFDWSTSPSTLPQVNQQQANYQRAQIDSFDFDVGWSSKLSKLSNSDSGDDLGSGSGEVHHGGDFTDGPGPVFPLPESGGFDWGIVGGGDGVDGGGWDSWGGGSWGGDGGSDGGSVGGGSDFS